MPQRLIHIQKRRKLLTKHDKLDPETAVIHAGQHPDPTYGGVSMPISILTTMMMPR